MYIGCEPYPGWETCLVGYELASQSVNPTSSQKLVLQVGSLIEIGQWSKNPIYLLCLRASHLVCTNVSLSLSHFVCVLVYKCRLLCLYVFKIARPYDSIVWQDRVSISFMLLRVTSRCMTFGFTLTEICISLASSHPLVIHCDALALTFNSTHFFALTLL